MARTDSTRSSRSAVSSVRVVSSSSRDWLSSGLLGDLARERMRRYEEKSGRLVWRVARTSLEERSGC
jgi:hypothetical protein